MGSMKISSDILLDLNFLFFASSVSRESFGVYISTAEMSSRLIILPKKKWNVWNRDNVEKVLKDEREERERVEETAEKERQNKLKVALKTLRDKKRGGDGCP